MYRLFAPMLLAALLCAGSVPASLAQSPGASAPPGPSQPAPPFAVTPPDPVNERLAGVDALIEAIAHSKAAATSLLADRPDPPLLSATPFEKAQYRDREAAWRTALKTLSDDLAALRRRLDAGQADLNAPRGEAAAMAAARFAAAERDLRLAERDLAAVQRDVDATLRETRSQRPVRDRR